jgi:hypothetical protein
VKIAKTNQSQEHRSARRQSYRETPRRAHSSRASVVGYFQET